MRRDQYSYLYECKLMRQFEYFWLKKRILEQF